MVQLMVVYYLNFLLKTKKNESNGHEVSAMTLIYIPKMLS